MQANVKVSAILSLMPEREQRIVELSYAGLWSHEIAARVGVPVNIVFATLDEYKRLWLTWERGASLIGA